MANEKEQAGENHSGDSVVSGANRNVIAAFLFVLGYGLLFSLGMANKAIGEMVNEIPFANIFLPVPEFTSPMYFLLPVVGFFLMFFLIDWINDYFEKKPGFSVLLPVLFLALSMAAFYIAIFWYIGNYAQLAGRVMTLDEATRLFFMRWRTSAFYLFVLSGLLGWVSRVALEKIKL